MKTFKKIALVTAIAAAPFAAQAGLVSIEDAEMSNVTGQAGVTIEIDLGTEGIKVGSVVYTDTAHTDVEVTDADGVEPGASDYVSTMSGTDGGSVTLENINVNLTGTLVQTIDVSSNGDLEMTMSSPGALTITAGNNAADTTGAFSALKLGAAGNESELINNLDLSVNLGASTTTIMNLGGTSQALVTVPAVADRTGLITDETDVGFDQAAVDAADAADLANATATATNAQITTLNAIAPVGLGLLANAGVTGSYANDVSSMAIKMNASVQVTDMNLGLFGYTKAQANVLSQGHSTVTEAKTVLTDIDGSTAIAGLTFNASTGIASATDATNADVVTYNDTLQATKNLIATGSAVQVEGVTVQSSTGGAIALNQVIWAVGGNANEAGSKAGVYIQMGAMNMNIGVDAIKIGGSSIGSVAINGLELAGLTQRIYGH